MFIFNPSYTQAQDTETLTRLTRLKKAADRVYQYYEWLSEDHRNSLTGDAGKTEVEGLCDDVRIALFLSTNQEPLVHYFVACVLFALLVSHADAAPSGTPCPIDRSTLEGMYDAKAVSVLLNEADYQLISYSTGSFLLSDTADPGNLSTMALARKGSLVMADQELTETISLQTLLLAEPDGEELDEEQQGHVFLRELHRLETESKAMVNQSSD